MTENTVSHTATLDEALSSLAFARVAAAEIRPLDALLHLNAAQAWITHSVAETVPDARAAGHTWDEVGAALGVSRQAAQQRYRDSD